MSGRQYDKAPIQGAYGQLSRVAEGNYQDVAVNRMGALVTVDQLLEWALQGRTFHTQQGDAGTKVNFAETAYDEDQPQFALRVPEGRIVIPLSLVVKLEDMAGTDNHLVWSTATNDIGNGTSTALTASNLRTDSSRAASSVPRSLYTGDATAATGLIELIRWHVEFAATTDGQNPRFEWNIREAALIPILVGPATLQFHLWATATAPQGFSEVAWAELDKADLVI